MKKYLAGMAVLAILSACNKTETTTEGLEYKIIETKDDARMVASGDILEIHLQGKLERNDSLIFNSYMENKPFNIPAEEPSLKSVFSLMKKGDSVMFVALADTLFKNFNQPLPPGIMAGDRVVFHARLVDLYNSEEMQKKIDEKTKEFMVKDSLESMAYLQTLKDVKTTASGLKYQIIKKGNGKQAKAGDNVTVKYRGSLLNGQVFDETKEGAPDFNFTIGARQVIAGWDEGFQLMSVGDQYKLIIPWQLGYGQRGMGPIPPYATLIFDVELVNIESKK